MIGVLKTGIDGVFIIEPQIFDDGVKAYVHLQ